MASRIEGDHQFTGVVSFTNQASLPSASIAASHIKADARIETSKCQQRTQKTYSQESATAAADEARAIHVVYGATGSIIKFRAGSVVANIGAATVTVDLKKNGTTVLSSVITLNNTHAAYQEVDATVSSAALVAGDVLEVVIDGTAGGGTLAKGIYVNLVVDELAA